MRVYREGKILRLDLEGVVTNDELAGIDRTSHQYEFSAPTVPHRNIDLTRCTEFQLEDLAVQALAKLRKAMQFPNGFKSAIVTAKPEHMPEAQAWIGKT